MSKSINNLIFGVDEKNVRLDVRGFFYQNESAKKHLEDIGLYFLKGYHSCLSQEPGSAIEEFKKVNNKFIGFTYEGAAMSLALLDFFNPWRASRLQQFIENEGSEHIYMLHVGAGWAMARLPVRPEKLFLKYHPLYKWLAIDGYGFHQAYFSTEKYVRKQTLPKNLSKEAVRVFYQGVGRCLWFVEGTNPQRISATINTFPAALHPELWSGIGLAATYACGVGEESLKEIATLANKYLPCLAQGAAFAAKARVRANNLVPETIMACAVFAERSPEDLALITDEAMRQIGRDLSTYASYDSWRDRIRNMIYEQSKNYA